MKHFRKQPVRARLQTAYHKGGRLRFWTDFGAKKAPIVINGWLNLSAQTARHGIIRLPISWTVPMKYFLFTVIAVALTGCSTPPSSQSKLPPPVPINRYEIPSDAVQLAQAMVARHLKDPDSAKFRDAFYASTDPRGDGRDKSKDTVCIEVNGKNSYGAYNGFTWALIAMESKTVLLSSDPDAVANRFCSLAVPGPTVSQQAEQNR